MFENGKTYVLSIKDTKTAAGEVGVREETLKCTKVNGKFVSFVSVTTDEAGTADGPFIVQVTYDTASSKFQGAREYTGPHKVRAPQFFVAGGNK